MEALDVFDDAAELEQRGTPVPEGVDQGTAIRWARTRLGRSLREVAAVTGFSQSLISQIERGVTPASDRALELIATAVGLNAASLRLAEPTSRGNAFNSVVVRYGKAFPTPFADVERCGIASCRHCDTPLARVVALPRKMFGVQLPGGWRVARSSRAAKGLIAEDPCDCLKQNEAAA